MQCFICFAYLMIICNAHPPKDREPTQRRSLFHDVIESLRIRAQIPEEFSDEENQLKQSYDKYNYENDLNLPDDVDFIPRRNDRLEMPTLKYRFPKNLDMNNTKGESVKEEIVLYIDSPDESETTTFKPKTKRPRPAIKNKIKTKESEEPEKEQKPVTNSLSGLSQIGNRESQTVVKPTVIVNFRGSVNNRESDIRLERRKNVTKSETVPQNIFNINQEIKLERAIPSLASGDAKGVPNKVKQDVTIETERGSNDEDMMMCESSSWKESDDRHGRQLLQISLSV